MSTLYDVQGIICVVQKYLVPFVTAQWWSRTLDDRSPRVNGLPPALPAP